MAVNKYGVGEPLESAPVIMRNPFVPPGPPQELEITNITRDSMTVCWTRPETTGGSEIVGYIVEKRDRAGVRWTKCNKRRVTDLRFRVTGLTEDHEYEFRLSAENAAGVGQPSQATPYLKACDPTFEPGCPTNAHVVDTTKDSISLAWHRPIYDGGCEIQGYAVEICKADEEEWTICTPASGVNATKFTITKLIEHQEYKVRICAINKLGVGEPTEIQGVVKPVDKIDPPEMILDSELRKGVVVRAGGSMKIYIPFKGRPTPEISWAKEDGDLPGKVQIENGADYTQLSIEICDRNDAGKYILKLENSAGTKSAFVSVRVLDTPGAPLNLTVKDIKRESVTLTWEPPLIDGGARIKNYLVEKRESTRKAYSSRRKHPDTRWMKASFTNVIDTQFTITGLTEDCIYEFRVIARNAAGILSAPSQSTGEITAKDEIEAPEATMDPKFKDMTVVHAGETFVIDADYTGKPLPDVIWLKDGKEIDKTTPRMEVKTTITHTILTVKDCIRVDGGHFVLKLTNVGGVKMIPVNVKVLDRPGPPDGPLEVKGVTAEKCYLHWSHPSHDGGASISHYIIERRETSRLSWTMVEPKIQAVSYKITKLLPGNEYIFRVTAVNKYGVGEPLESDPVIARNPFTTPSAPSTPEAGAITRDSIVLTWERPENNGGAEIEGYILEKRDKDGIRWTKCNKKRLNDLRFRCTGLTEGHSYEFRVSAENAAGVGKPSAPTEYIKACDATYPPGPPNNPKVTDHSSTTVSLSWSRPIYDGGAAISGYVIEMKEVAEEEWTVCTPPTALEATIDGLTTGEEYSFRVIAVNDKGRSDPKPLATPVVVKDITIEPIFNLLFNTYSVKAGDDLKIEVPFKGRPQPEVSWKKDGQVLKQTTRVNVLTSKTASKIVIKDATKDDVGKYEITLTNAVGTKTAEISVIILDKPGPPSNIKVDEVSADFISLSWDPPTYDGGCQINNYVVEKRDTTTTTWQIVSATVARTSIKVSRLNQGTEYQFRIAAENRYGKSHAIDSAPIVAQYPFEPPGPPTNLHVAHATKYGMQVVWGRPASDGGSPIIGYHIECKDQSSILWTKVNRGLLAENQFKMTDVIRRDSGQYVLTLQNVAGTRSVAVNCKVLDRPGPASGPL
uniref:Titin n=1 Tax=Myripristis murdjan TaxID=586833 RepID=A0A667WU33_9TELE